MINKILVFHRVHPRGAGTTTWVKALLDNGFIEHAGSYTKLAKVGPVFAYRECEDIVISHYSTKEPNGVSLNKFDGKWYLLDKEAFTEYKAPRKMPLVKVYSNYPRICWVDDNDNMFFQIGNKYGRPGTQLSGIPGEKPVKVLHTQTMAWTLTKSNRVYVKEGLYSDNWKCLDHIPLLKQLECLLADPLILCGVTMDGLFWHSHASNDLPIANWKHFPDDLMWKGGV